MTNQEKKTIDRKIITIDGMLAIDHNRYTELKNIAKVCQEKAKGKNSKYVIKCIMNLKNIDEMEKELLISLILFKQSNNTIIEFLEDNKIGWFELYTILRPLMYKNNKLNPISECVESKSVDETSIINIIDSNYKSRSIDEIIKLSVNSETAMSEMNINALLLVKETFGVDDYCAIVNKLTELLIFNYQYFCVHPNQKTKV